MISIFLYQRDFFQCLVEFCNSADFFVNVIFLFLTIYDTHSFLALGGQQNRFLICFIWLLCFICILCWCTCQLPRPLNYSILCIYTIHLYSLRRLKSQYWFYLRKNVTKHDMCIVHVSKNNKVNLFMLITLCRQTLPTYLSWKHFARSSGYIFRYSVMSTSSLACRIATGTWDRSLRSSLGPSWCTIFIWEVYLSGNFVLKHRRLP